MAQRPNIPVRIQLTSGLSLGEAQEEATIPEITYGAHISDMIQNARRKEIRAK